MQSEFDVLISHSSKDKAFANELVTGLEADAIRCWIAPRNVQPGKTWGGSIMRGIRDTDVFVLILTAQSNASSQVLNEVERAVSLQKPIVCYRTEDVVLSDDLELFLSATHWIDAFGRPIAETLPMLGAAIRPLLSRSRTTASPPVVTADDDEVTPDEREEFLRNGKKAYLAREFTLANDYFTEAADAGSGEALFYLGEMHRKGEGVKRVAAKAKHFYQNAIAKDSALGYWGLARMLDDADELPDRAKQYHEQAREAIAEKAVEEDAYCCFLYSLMYDEGKGVNKDEKRAERWLERAVENGYKPIYAPKAKDPLLVKPAQPRTPVRRLPPGRKAPVRQETTDSTKPTSSTQPTFLVAAKDNVDVGKPSTPSKQIKKTGLPRGVLITIFCVVVLAVVWFWSRATSFKYKETDYAADTSVIMMQDDPEMAVDSASTMSADTAISYSNKSPYELLKLAEKGDAMAQLWLGSKYDDGIGVVKNDRKAVEWYRKAAEQGNATAQCNLGIMYRDGEGVEKNYQKAFEWYSKSAEQGNARAQNSLGFMYQNGKGMAKNYQKAFEWYNKSVEQGNAAAQNNLGIMYEQGEGVEKNYAEAVKWYRKSADQGNIHGQYDLGDMYEYGKGVAKDLSEAKRLYRLSAAQGGKDAKEGLKRLGTK